MAAGWRTGQRDAGCAGPEGLDGLEARVMLSSSFETTGMPVLKSDVSIWSVVAADLNHDGVDDVVAAVGSKVRVRMGVSGGTLAPARTVGRFALNAGQLAAGDFDGDGNLDIVSARTGGEYEHDRGPGVARTWVRVLFGDGTGRFVGGPKIAIEERVRSLTVGHFLAGPSRQVLFNGWLLDVRRDGAGGSILATNVVDGGRAAASADLDGDGLDEIAAVGRTPGTQYEREVVLLRSMGGSVFARVFARNVGDLLPLTGLEALGFGDVVAGGEPELVYTGGGNAYLATGYFGVDAGAGGLALSEPVRIELRPGGQRGEHAGLVGVRDVNGDGSVDVVVSYSITWEGHDDAATGRPTASTSLVVLPGRGDGTFGRATYPSLTIGATSYDGGASWPITLTPYVLLETGGPGRGPDLLGFTSAFTGGWRFVRVRNTEAWKPPVVYAGLLDVRVTAYAPGYRGGPGIAMGDTVEVRLAGAYTPEAARLADIARVRFAVDGNGDGVIDAGDLVLGDGVAVSSLYVDRYWKLANLGVDRSWLGLATNGEVHVLVEVTDTMGAQRVVGTDVVVRVM